MTVMSSTAARPALSTANRVGLALCALLGVLDVINFLLAPEPAPGEESAPPVVIAATSVLGVVTLAGVALAWRNRNRIAARVTAGSRVVSVLLGLPAFFVPGVPAWVVAVSAVLTLLTAVAVFLLLRRPRTA
jgi:hypothetical protein